MSCIVVAGMFDGCTSCLSFGRLLRAWATSMTVGRFPVLGILECLTGDEGWLLLSFVVVGDVCVSVLLGAVRETASKVVELVSIRSMGAFTTMGSGEFTGSA